VSLESSIVHIYTLNFGLGNIFHVKQPSTLHTTRFLVVYAVSFLCCTTNRLEERLLYCALFINLFSLATFINQDLIWIWSTCEFTDTTSKIELNSNCWNITNVIRCVIIYAYIHVLFINIFYWSAIRNTE